jgi:hypothetical protein
MTKALNNNIFIALGKNPVSSINGILAIPQLMGTHTLALVLLGDFFER